MMFRFASRLLEPSRRLFISVTVLPRSRTTSFASSSHLLVKYTRSHGTHQGFPELRDGNRAVRISLSKDIPGVVSIAGFECRVWYRRQPAFCEICRKLGHRSHACPLDGLCRRCLQPGHQACSCRNAWAASRPAAPAAPAPPAAPVAPADISIADPSGAADASVAADSEMSDVEYAPAQSEVDSDALSMVEDASGDVVWKPPSKSVSISVRSRGRSFSLASVSKSFG